MATPIPESERKVRQEFQKKIFVVQAKYHEVYRVLAEIGAIQAELWLLNDKIMNGDKE